MAIPIFFHIFASSNKTLYGKTIKAIIEDNKKDTFQTIKKCLNLIIKITEVVLIGLKLINYKKKLKNISKNK